MRSIAMVFLFAACVAGAFYGIAHGQEDAAEGLAWGAFIAFWAAVFMSFGEERP